MKKPTTSNRFFRRFFVIGLVISIIPVLLLSVLAQSIFHLYRESAVEQARQVVRQDVGRIDSTFSSILNTCRHYALNDSDVGNILYWKKDRQRYLAEYADLLRLAQNSLNANAFRYEEAALNDFWIIQPTTKILLSASNAISGLEKLYYFFSDYGLSFEDWRNLALNQRSALSLMIGSIDRKQQLCAFYFQPDTRSKEASGGFTLMFCMDPARLLSQSNVLKQAESLVITDASGRLLFSKSADTLTCFVASDSLSYLEDGYIGAIQNRRSVVVSASSETYGYQLYAVYPYARLFARQRMAESTFYAVITAVLIACVVSSYYSARRHAEPLVPFIQLAPDACENATYQDAMSSIYGNIVLQQEVNRKMLNRHSTMTRHMLLECLLETPYVENAQMEQILPMCQIDLSDDHFAVFVIRIMDNARDTLAGYVYDLCVSMFSDRGYIYLSKRNDIAVLFHDSFLTQENCRVTAEEMDMSLFDLLKAPYQISVGSIVDTKRKIALSYANAIETLNRSVGNASRVLMYDSALQQSFYNYTAEMQNTLSRHLKAGKEAGVMTCLEGIWAANNVSGSNTSSATLLLASNVMGTIYQVLADLQNPAISAKTVARMAELNRSMSVMMPQTIMTEISAVCMEICRAIQQTQDSDLKQLGKRIEAYLQQNFASPEISVENAAVALDVSIQQINKACREVYNSSFIKMLETCRLDAAAKYIESGDKTIVNIGEMVGYLSYTSFSRAFKRVYGISPSEYRESIAQDRPL